MFSQFWVGVEQTLWLTVVCVFRGHLESASCTTTVNPAGLEESRPEAQSLAVFMLPRDQLPGARGLLAFTASLCGPSPRTTQTHSADLGWLPPAV